MSDYLVRAIDKEKGVRTIVCQTTDLVAEAAQRHDLSANATAALGRLMTGTTLLGALLKVRQRIAVKFDGDGPAGKMLAESDSYGKVRGYMSGIDTERPVQPNTLDPYDVSGSIGSGIITVVRDLLLPELSRSTIPITDGTVNDDLTYYLNQSEQTPSYIDTGVLLNDDGRVRTAGGVLVQTIGDAPREALSAVVNRLQEMPPISEQIADGRPPETITADLFADIEYDLLEERPVMFHCGCSRERAAKALITLGREELMFLILDGEAVVDCPFCHDQYVFTKPDLEQLLQDAVG